MTDRELLERAAKAAGDEFGNLLSHGKWNPLLDDASALRLAVKLRLQIDWMEHAVAVGYGRCREDSLQRRNEVGEGYEDGEDQGAATRRAIVRAAAALAHPEEKK